MAWAFLIVFLNPDFWLLVLIVVLRGFLCVSQSVGMALPSACHENREGCILSLQAFPFDWQCYFLQFLSDLAPSPGLQMPKEVVLSAFLSDLVWDLAFTWISHLC